jgi:hypothetical protein
VPVTETRLSLGATDSPRLQQRPPAPERTLAGSGILKFRKRLWRFILTDHEPRLASGRPSHSHPARMRTLCGASVGPPTGWTATRNPSDHLRGRDEHMTCASLERTLDVMGHVSQIGHVARKANRFKCFVTPNNSGNSSAFCWQKRIPTQTVLGCAILPLQSNLKKFKLVLNSFKHFIYLVPASEEV